MDKMGLYTSCFIAIPLPEAFQLEFENLLKKIGDISPKLQTVYPYTPHITLCYLGIESQEGIEEIKEILTSKIRSVRHDNITIGRVGYFGQEEVKIIFLDVIIPKDVEQLNNELNKSLSIYISEENHLPFHPHMTLARVKNPLTTEEYHSLDDNLQNLTKEISWSFPFSEVCTYGADSTKSPEKQVKLMIL
jgi:2'-5' RNA ligase